jgi:DNA-binding PadR family transcriptional regulator
MSVRFGLLGLIQERPRHGYELIQAFEALVGGESSWELKPAQAYSTLKRLEEGGQIRASGSGEGEDRVIYSITEAGREELSAWLTEPVAERAARDEFFVKLLVCLRLDGPGAQRLLYAQRSSLLKELHALHERRTLTPSGSQLSLVLMLDLGSMRIEASLRWLDMVEARLDEIMKQPQSEPTLRPRGRPRQGEKRESDD